MTKTQDLAYFELVRKDIDTRLPYPYTTILVGIREFRIIDNGFPTGWVGHRERTGLGLAIAALGPDHMRLELRLGRIDTAPHYVDLHDPDSLPTIHNWIASYGIPIRK